MWPKVLADHPRDSGLLLLFWDILLEVTINCAEQAGARR